MNRVKLRYHIHIRLSEAVTTDESAGNSEENDTFLQEITSP